MDDRIKTPMDNPNFRRWFGRSKVVDREGNPLVVYHGTIESFTKFDTSLEKSRTAYAPKDVFFFSKSPKNASSYALHDIETDKGWYYSYGKGSSVIPVYLSMQNPYTLNAKGGGFDFVEEAVVKAKENGNDGIIVENV